MATGKEKKSSFRKTKTVGQKKFEINTERAQKKFDKVSKELTEARKRDLAKYQEGLKKLDEEFGFTVTAQPMLKPVRGVGFVMEAKPVIVPTR